MTQPSPWRPADTGGGRRRGRASWRARSMMERNSARAGGTLASRPESLAKGKSRCSAAAHADRLPLIDLLALLGGTTPRCRRRLEL